MKRVFYLICLVLLPALAFGQAKTIKAKGDYIHKATGLAFPKTQFDGYERTRITAFDKKREDVGLNYKLQEGGKSTLVSIYIYPAEAPMEDRLHRNFLDVARAAVNVGKAVDLDCALIRSSNENYICNGMRGVFTTQDGNLSEVVLFECGGWYYKLRITTSLLELDGLTQLTERILEAYPPPALTAVSPAGDDVDMKLGDGLIMHPVLMKSVTGASISKINWALKQVSAQERASGFPGMYLALHETALKTFAEISREAEGKDSDPSIQRYIDEVNEIVDSGFLNEFILDQFFSLLWLPDGFVPDTEGYQAWKQDREFSVNLNHHFSRVGFKKKQ